MLIGPSERGGSQRDDFSVVVAGQEAAVAVRVRRHHASRRLRLRYDPIRGELRLTMPARQRLASARHWVDEQTAWIARQIARRPVVEPAIGAGSFLPWDGGKLVVDWTPTAPRMPRIHGTALLVGGPSDTVGPRIRRWLQTAAREDFAARSHHMARAAGLPIGRVAVGDPRGRWGSCTATGNIRYNWRLIMAPDFVRHALTAHEVAHLAHMNHGPDFHRLADRLGGEANQASKHWLKVHGPMLHAIQFS